MKIKLGKMKKYIALFCAVLTMFVFAFGSVPVLAATDDDDSEFNSFTYLFGYTSNASSGGQYHYRYNYFALTTRPADLKCVVVRNGDTVNVLIMSLNPFDYVTDYAMRNVGSDGDVHSGVVSGNKAYSAIHVQETGIDYYYIAQSCVGYDINVYGNISGVLDYTGVENIKANTDYQVILNGGTPEHYTPRTPELDESNATYDREIGVIKNLKTQSLASNNLTHADDVMSEASGELIVYKDSWDQYSDTGFDLLQDGVYVAFYDQLNATYWTNPFSIGDGKKYIGEKHFVKRVTGELFMRYGYSDIQSAVQTDYDKLISLRGSLGSLDRDDDCYYRIEVYDSVTGIWKYGPYLKNPLSLDSTDPDNVSHVVDPDGQEISDSSENGKPSDVVSGVGDTSNIENVDGVDGTVDVWDTVDVDDVDSIGNWFTAALRSLYDSVGIVPQFLASMFSYLPAQIFAFIALGIVICILLRIFGR